MMRGFPGKAALLLLPCLIQAIVLPNEIVSIESRSEAAQHEFETQGYGGPPTFFQHDTNDDIIHFAVPCPDCSDAEKEWLKQQIISVAPTAQSTKYCTTTNPIDLKINGKQAILTGELDTALQAYVGVSDLPRYSRNQISDSTRWINHCGCIGQQLDDEKCNGDVESTFTLEYLGLPSGQKPGFTVSYKQYRKPELLRFSSFSDIDIVKPWTLEQSAHYKSPVLRVQKALSPTSTAIPSSRINSPSTTTSAPLSSYTYFSEPARVGKSFFPIHRTTTPSVTGGTVHGWVLGRKFLSLATLLRKSPGWCHRPNPFVPVCHGIESLGMKAKSGAQRILGKIDEVVHPSYTQVQLKQQSPQSPLDIDQDNHDEIDTNADLALVVVGSDGLVAAESTGDLPGTEFFSVDSPTTSWLLDDTTTVKAFQVTSLVFIIVALSVSLFALLRQNPRLRAHWAAKREQRQRERAYARAARKHRFKNFFSRLTRSCPTEKNDVESTAQHDDALDWEAYEKRVSLDTMKPDQSKDAFAIQRDLLAFRKAHQFVDNILTARGGQSSRSDRIRRIRHQRASSFGSETTAPPPYESEGEDLVLDADGPRFIVIRRGTGGSSISPDSSVVSTSPRTSCADSDSEHDEKD